jgi:hypothetical protein
MIEIDPLDPLPALVASVRGRLGDMDYDLWAMGASFDEIREARRELKLIAYLRGKSTFGNDWMDALDGLPPSPNTTES